MIKRIFLSLAILTFVAIGLKVFPTIFQAKPKLNPTRNHATQQCLTARGADDWTSSHDELDNNVIKMDKNINPARKCKSNKF